MSLCGEEDKKDLLFFSYHSLVKCWNSSGPNPGKWLLSSNSNCIELWWENCLSPNEFPIQIVMFLYFNISVLSIISGGGRFNGNSNRKLAVDQRKFFEFWLTKVVHWFMGSTGNMTPEEQQSLILINNPHLIKFQYHLIRFYYLHLLPRCHDTLPPPEEEEIIAIISSGKVLNPIRKLNNLPRLLSNNIQEVFLLIPRKQIDFDSIWFSIIISGSSSSSLWSALVVLLHLQPWTRRRHAKLEGIYLFLLLRGMAF